MVLADSFQAARLQFGALASQQKLQPFRLRQSPLVCRKPELRHLEQQHRGTDLVDSPIPPSKPLAPLPEPSQAQEALDHFAKFAVHYHVLIRSTVMRSPILLAEFVRALLNEGLGIKAEAGGMELFRRINLEAGTQLLEVLPRDEIRGMVLRHLYDIMSTPRLVSDRSKLRNRKPAIRSISLGAGVQSTVLALMANKGLHGLPKPDVAVFADTGWEPPHVYEHLDWLESKLSFEVVRVQSGNLRDNILKGVSAEGRPYLTIPAFLVNPDGSNALANRQCTSQYKINAHPRLPPRPNWPRIRKARSYGRFSRKSGWASVLMRPYGPNPAEKNGLRASSHSWNWG